jgi:hypothetical protein
MGLVWIARSTKTDLFTLGVEKLFIESASVFKSFILDSLFLTVWLFPPQVHLFPSLFSFSTKELA